MKKNVHNKEFDNLYCRCNAVQETEWPGHATHRGEIKKPQKSLVITLMGKII